MNHIKIACRLTTYTMAFTTMHRLELGRSSADDTLDLLSCFFGFSGSKCGKNVSPDLDLIELGRRHCALAEDRCESDIPIYSQRSAYTRE